MSSLCLLAAHRVAVGTSRHHAESASSFMLRRRPGVAIIPRSDGTVLNSRCQHTELRPPRWCGLDVYPKYSASCLTKVDVYRSFSTATIETIASPSDDRSNYDSTKSTADESADQTRRTARRRRKSNPSTDQPQPSRLSQKEESMLPPLAESDYDPRHVVEQIKLASGWNQGRIPGQLNSSLSNRKFKERKWDYDFVRSAVDLYERHLHYVLNHLNSKGFKEVNKQENDEQSTNSTLIFAGIHPSPEKCNDTEVLVAASTLATAVRALTRSRLDTPLLSKRIRDIERLIGSIGWTPITEGLSYRLLEANGKAGNVRRTLALLELRRLRGYAPRETLDDVANRDQDDDSGNLQHMMPGEKEFTHVITSIQSAQLPLRRSRNIYLHESTFSESSLDNPTRYLDAILINMSQRGVPLRPHMAARMLNCYSSTGRTGRALHYFYKVVRDPIEEDGVYIPGPHPTHLGKEGLEEWKNKRRGEGMGRLLVPRDVSSNQTPKDSTGRTAYEELEAMMADDEEVNLKTRVRMNMHPPPPFHKIPSAVKGAPLFQSRDRSPFSHMLSSQSPTEENQQPAAKPFKKPLTKFEWELERDWSLSLTAAFAFADSLTHGACGHDPIELDLPCWNALIKACCYRGAFHRALKILNETMPQKGIDPDSFSYNTILAGLARVGDITTLRELLVNMTNKNVPVDKYTVQAMADGLLNMGDIAGASSIVQDIFNQHDALPPYTTQLKIIEFALANGLIFEAKRHVYFIQQLWKWQPSPHHSKSFCSVMEATKRNPKLNKDALQKLFRYFGEDLNDKDFF
eukprot:CCRYP_006301-RC/>CCRYP_006301-RC protein AED:0.25 eAED:0.25 QI:156/1/1/1/0.75/0.6/5/1622/800